MRARSKRKDVSNSWDGEVPVAICRIPELGLSCFGCCGYDWKPVDNIRRQVSYNTWRYKTLYTKKEVFAGTTEGVTGAGVCRAVIKLEDGTVGCPLHPAQNDGKDHRKGDCIRDFECNTLKHYKSWNERTKREFLGFLATRHYDTYDYSMANARGTILASFKKKKGFGRLLFKDFFR